MRTAVTLQPMTPTKTAIYVRVSTEEQKQHNSVSGQLEAVKKYIEQNSDKYELDEDLIYADEGQSGATHHSVRPALNSLYHDIRQGKVKTVIIVRIDRLFRRLRFLLEFMEDANRYGAEIIFLDFPELSSSVFGDAMFKMMGIIAEVERKLIEQRSKEGRIAAATKGKWLGGNIPFGFDIGENNYFVVCEKEAEVLREVYRRFTEENWTISELTKFINNKKLRQQKFKMSNQGKVWNFENKQLANLLRSKANIGQIHYGKSETITDPKGRKRQVKRRSATGMFLITAPRIVSDEMYSKAQLRIEQLEKERRQKIRNKDGEQDYLFTGLVTCGGCDKKWTGKLSTKLTPQYQHRRPTGLKCQVKKNSISEQVLEQCVWPVLMKFLTDPKNYLPQLEERLKNLNKDKTKSQKRIAGLQQEIEALKSEGSRTNAYCVKNNLPNKERLAMLKENSDEVAELQESINAEENLLRLHAEQRDRITHLEELEEIYRTEIAKPTHANKKRIIQTFVNRITLTDDKINADFSFFENPEDTNHAGNEASDPEDTNRKTAFQAEKATLVAESGSTGATKRT